MECDAVTVNVIIRSKADRVGAPVSVFSCHDPRAHDLPHSTAVYDAAGVFLGEVIADRGGVWKATIDGDTGHVGQWDQDFRSAIRTVALLAYGDPTFDRGHRAY